MLVQVQLFAGLQRFAPGGSGAFFMELSKNATLETLITRLELPADVERVILVNGRPARPELLLTNEDRVVMFPPMTGG